MATTSIWRVNGWLGKVLIYIENPDKTENPDFFEKQDMDGKEAQGLSDVIEYAVQQQKTGKAVESEGETVMRQFVSGVNCSPSTARDEMIAVKKRFGKEGGTVAYHGYQSFAPGEATPELAHEIGLALAKKLWGEKYQVLVATHLDRENHLHNHFVVNTVSFVDGIKYHRTEQDYFDMQRESDRLCREYGLSVIENPQRGKSKHYGEWRAEQEGRPTYLSLIKADVDTAIRQSMTERQFFYHLRQMGYDVKVGKDITVRPPNYPRGRKLMRNFGEDYSMENIRRRILAQRRPRREHRPEPFRCRLHGDLKQAKKVTGFRALYFHYCYLLGVFPQKQNRPPRRVPHALREDLIRAQELTDEARLLSRHRIDTLEQLISTFGKLQTTRKTGTSPEKKCKKIRTLPRPHKQKKTEDGFQASPVSFFFGCSIFMAPSIAPSMIGRYFSGHSFSLWPTRWRCSLSERSTSGLKYRSTGSPQVLISWITTGRLGIVPLFSMLARYRHSIPTISASALRARCRAFRAAFTSAPKVSKPGQSSTFAI